MAYIYSREDSRRVTKTSDEVMEKNWAPIGEKGIGICTKCGEKPYNAKLTSGICDDCRRGTKKKTDDQSLLDPKKARYCMRCLRITDDRNDLGICLDCAAMEESPNEEMNHGR